MIAKTPEEKREAYRRNLRRALDARDFGSFELLKKWLFVNDLQKLVIATEMMIDETKVTGEKLETAKLRLEMLRGAILFIYKLYDEGSTAVNLCSHLNYINLHLEVDNRELKKENIKLLQIIDEWKSQI